MGLKLMTYIGCALFLLAGIIYLALGMEVFAGVSFIALFLLVFIGSFIVKKFPKTVFYINLISVILGIVIFLVTANVSRIDGVLNFIFVFIGSLFILVSELTRLLILEEKSGDGIFAYLERKIIFMNEKKLSSGYEVINLNLLVSKADYLIKKYIYAIGSDELFNHFKVYNSVNVEKADENNNIFSKATISFKPRMSPFLNSPNVNKRWLVFSGIKFNDEKGFYEYKFDSDKYKKVLATNPKYAVASAFDLSDCRFIELTNVAMRYLIRKYKYITTDTRLDFDQNGEFCGLKINEITWTSNLPQLSNSSKASKISHDDKNEFELFNKENSIDEYKSVISKMTDAIDSIENNRDKKFKYEFEENEGVLNFKD